MMHRYHCFWVNPFGFRHHYEAYDDLDRVLDLVKRDRLPSDADSDVTGLRVIYGELLDFEPATVVQTYRVKEPRISAGNGPREN